MAFVPRASLPSRQELDFVPFSAQETRPPMPTAGLEGISQIMIQASQMTSEAMRRTPVSLGNIVVGNNAPVPAPSQRISGANAALLGLAGGTALGIALSGDTGGAKGKVEKAKVGQGVAGSTQKTNSASAEDSTHSFETISIVDDFGNPVTWQGKRPQGEPEESQGKQVMQFKSGDRVAVGPSHEMGVVEQDFGSSCSVKVKGQTQTIPKKELMFVPGSP